MATKTVLKLTPIHAVVKIVGSGSATISLATDLLRSNEVAATPVVNISGIYWSIPASGQNATISRNSVVQWDLAGSYHQEFSGFADVDANTTDIVVAIPAGGGTVIVELVKVNGFGNTSHRNQGFFDPGYTGSGGAG